MNITAVSNPRRYADPTVKVQALAYLMFERPDLDQARRFLSDFGLESVYQTSDELFLRAADTQPYCYHVRRAAQAAFIGMGWCVSSRDDLLRLAQLPGASRIEALQTPGGGERLRLRDPSGFVVDVVCGRAAVPARPSREPTRFNSPHETLRINGTQRIPLAPPQITRLGHVVMEVADFKATCDWYARHLGLIPSDVQLLPDGSPAVAFMRMNLGDVPSDHHSLALAQGVAAVYSHSAYEVVDADAVGMGQRWLRDQAYTHAWGVGRHILGSQIFDYWQDPWGDKHEHYCDGDMFNADVETGFHPVSREAMAQWGPPMPRSFTQPKFSLGFVAAVVRNLRRSPDLSFKKLLVLARLFA